MKVKEESEKVGLKHNIQKTKIMASSPITSWQIDGETMETVRDFIFLGSKITSDDDCSHEIKRHLLLGRKVMTKLEIKLPTSAGSLTKQESSRKISISALLTMPKPLTVWITINCGKFWKRWEDQTTWPASWETYMQVRKQQNWTWNNRLVPNRKRSSSRLYIVTLLI